jgi:SAM-dependent methyltransferase
MSNPEKHQNSENPTYSGDFELQSLENFMPKYLDEITNIISEEIKKIPAPRDVLEFGAGRGSISIRCWEKTKTKPICVEIDPNLIDFLESENFQVYKSLNEIKSKYDLIYTVNVLEHVLDDKAVLKDIYLRLKNKGKIVIFVPAFQSLMSAMDHEVGHVRRYSKKELQLKVKESGFKVNKTVYFDSLGTLATIITKLLGYRGKLNLGGEKSLKLYNSILFPISRTLDNLLMQRIVGKNLILIAEKV